FRPKDANQDGGDTEMFPNFLIPETVIREAGTGPELSVGSITGGLLLLPLGITRIIEQQSLDISVWGSADNVDWGAKALISFPQKFYCGTNNLLLTLTKIRMESIPDQRGMQPPGHKESEGPVRPEPFR